MNHLSDLRFSDLLEQIAAKTPVPGGGAAAAAIGATACALASMVVHYSQGKADLAAHQAALDASDQDLTKRRYVFLELADQDAEAYAAYTDASKLAKDDPTRTAAMAAALDLCVQVPLRALDHARHLARTLEDLKDKVNWRLRSDLAIAALMAEAAARSCRCNIEINLPRVASESARDAHQAAMLRLLDEVHRYTRSVLTVCGG